MLQANLSGDEGKQTENLEKLLCMEIWKDELINQHLIFLSAFTIFLSITAFLGNALILIALHKESSLHSPSKLLHRCLAAIDLYKGLIVGPLHVAYFLSVVHEDWNLCRYTSATFFTTGFTLSLISLFIMTAIGVDRLLALLLGLRYRQVVTVKRTFLLAVIFCVVSSLSGTSYFMNIRIANWYGYIVIPICLVTATFSYFKIFRRLRHNQNQVQVHVPQQPSQPVLLNMARYRKAVHSALWVQLALVICYLPCFIDAAVLPKERLSSSEFLVFVTAVTLNFLNSSLNPFLYCWKISEVRQAVKETVRQALCYPYS